MECGIDLLEQCGLFKIVHCLGRRGNRHRFHRGESSFPCDLKHLFVVGYQPRSHRMLTELLGQRRVSIRSTPKVLECLSRLSVWG